MEVRVLFEVCSACQFDCALCAHSGLKAFDPHYHLSLPEVESFIRATEDSGYTANLGMHGPGEPLLWRHLTEGLALLRTSNAIQKITINSNGLTLPKVAHILDMVDSVRVSLYPGVKMEIIEHEKVVYNPHTFFMAPQYPAPIPCKCICDGPMLYKDLIFPNCGPPLFDALERMGSNISPLSFAKKLAPHYAEGEILTGTFAECAYCWANSGAIFVKEAHRTTNSKPSHSLREIVQLAFGLYNAGNISGADAVCEELIAQKTNSFYILYLSGTIAVQRKEWNLARTRLEEALGNSSGVPAGRITEVESLLKTIGALHD